MADNDFEARKEDPQMATMLSQATSEYGALVAKTLVLINGAASIAILAFVAHIWTSKGREDPVIAAIFSAMNEFVIGVAAGVLVATFGYFSNYFYSAGWRIATEPKHTQMRYAAVTFHVFALFSAVYAFLRFWWGVQATAEALIG